MLPFLLLLSLFPSSSTFNMDSGRSTTIVSEGVDEMGGHFGWSVATTVGDVVYVGAPRGCNNTGEVYKCNMAGVDFSKQQHQKEDLCTKINVPNSKDPRISDENQGLGESMAVDHTKKRLLVCLPRRKSRFTFCMMDKTKHANLRGICYEMNTVTDEVSEVYDHCRSDPWQELTQQTEMKFAAKKYGCLQLQIDNTSSTSGQVQFNLNTGTIKILDISYTPSTEMFTFSYPGITDVEYPCAYDGISFYYKKSSAQTLKALCYGRDPKTNIDLDDPDITNNVNHIELYGFTKYWMEEYDDFTSDYRDTMERLYDNCMLGYSSWYDPKHGPVISAPGYDIFDGTVFVNGTLDSTLTNVTEKGLVYRSAEFNGAIWSAISGNDKSQGSLAGSVIISKEGLLKQIILESGLLTGFGEALMMWSNGEGVLQLLIGAPRDVNDCGVVYLYTLDEQNEQFETQARVLSDVCGGFGYTLSDIGDIDGDSYRDVAVGAVYDNSVHIMMGGSAGLDERILQIIRPTSKVLEPYRSTFGYAVSRYDGKLVVGDPVGNTVHIYQLLPVLNSTRTITCSDNLDIDTSPAVISCNICFMLTSRTSSPAGDVNLTVRWEISHKNISYASESVDHIVYTNKDLDTMNCTNAEFSRTANTDIRDFDLKAGLNMAFSFEQGPHPTNGRIVAVDPRTLQPLQVQVNTVGRCGKEFCRADFSLEVEYQIERFEESETFRDIIGKNDSVLYFGGSREVIVFDITIDVLAGKYIDEVLTVELNNTFQVDSPSEECSSTKSSSISIYLTQETNMCNWTCPGDSFVQCTLQNGVSEGERRLQLRLPVVQNAYLNPDLQIDFTLKTQRNMDTNSSNNARSFSVPVFKFLEVAVKSRLEPAHLTNIRLRNYQAGSASLQGYGPEQTLILELTNEGSSKVEMTALSVIYPVIYQGKELVYVVELDSSAPIFHCNEQTIRQVNYRNLMDLSRNETVSGNDTEKFGSLLVEPCHSDEWKCVNLTCFIESMKPGSATTFSIETYINAEYASNFINVTIPISYSRTFFDTRFIARELVQRRSVDTIIEVLPGFVNTLWYVVGAFVGGSMILAGFVILLIKCGFFSRSKRDELKLMKNVVMEISIGTKEDDKEEDDEDGHYDVIRLH